MNWQEILLPLGLALIAAVPGVLAWQRQSRRDKADAASTLTGSALEMFRESRAEVATLKAQIAELEAEVDQLKTDVDRLLKENRELHYGVRVLSNQVTDEGRIPIWDISRLQTTGRGLATSKP